mmetsp:Transcript_17209/g.37564  ORF Transcript_17209/g.37564 Transcript_17209/m.37564 type:complete len:892 (+) Transcript_17209:230-2905(+)|eukprot:CAMPEP_0178507970 /NCGR_PEP_ID=MMETSP0696-20121128/20501_1 /TAXON_ID=265572 /ORGANISM="Extubocellulus spinifer, Strain CCMP396" /LENGTH=891 /DNA_ID=CAMNT_0020137489 /DNA_START=706 /DNA_END=3381 /DNA_ORIENTATION=+
MAAREKASASRGKGPSKGRRSRSGSTSSDYSDGDGDNKRQDGETSSVSVYDSDQDQVNDDSSSGEEEYDSNDEEEEGDDVGGSDDEDDNEDDDDLGFEEQGSSDEDEDVLADQTRDAENSDDDEDDDELEILSDDGIGVAYDEAPRTWRTSTESAKRSAVGKPKTKGSDPAGTAEAAASKWMHTDDLSSDDEDEDGTSNRIGRVPLHWYDEFEHIGYDAHGAKVVKQRGAGVGGHDLLDEAIRHSDDVSSKKFTVHDALNARDVELTPRQIELIRRIQSGAYAHPEHDGNADYIDYYSGVDKEISGINADRHPPKARFQPSKWEKLQVRRLLHRLKCGSINMDFLEGKIRDMNDLNKSREKDTDAPRLLWKGDEEDELALKKGPQHISAPKMPPPGHAESYIPPDEYLPTEEDIKEWEEMDAKERPHGLLVPKKHANLRSVGSYPHSVRERFERCLDLYLCPRAMKRRLNIDPESLVPSIPRAADLRPFPTSRAVQYETPTREGQEQPPMIRCLAVSPDGQFLASGASDGFVRLWEVQTSRLLRSWDISSIIANGGVATDANGENESTSKSAEPTPVVAVEWNPNRSHHVLLVAVGKCAIIIATGTGGTDHAETTEALLSAAISCKDGGSVKNAKAAKAVSWVPLGVKKLRTLDSSWTTPISAFGGRAEPICLLRTNKEVASLKWHGKGDYFVTVSPKAGASAVLIHQLSKANSQQPFSKAKGEVQCACFHPNKPFLFVASQQHVRVYHLIKQSMAKRLLSGCRWISSIDIHPSGDHVVIGSLDRRMVWFDLDLSNTPYKTLKYHERALRSVSYHPRYPLLASSSDDGTVHIFHSMVYSDLMRNPLIVPVKILRGHSVVNKFGVLASVFHPTQPWLFSAGADGKIHLYQDI